MVGRQSLEGMFDGRMLTLADPNFVADQVVKTSDDLNKLQQMG